jgi:2,3-dihydroxybiphenyl 1,2-dioxygenase
VGRAPETPADLDMFAARLEAAGTKVTLADGELRDRRFVAQMIWFDDPAGNRIELFHGAHEESEAFKPGRPHSGFNTGPYGLGHAVLNVVDAESLVPFYRDILGFSLSDYGLTPVPLFFFHVNGRHHSFALVGSGKAGFHHFMVEYNGLDDVGQGYDLATEREDGVAYTLGRHTNDWMTSFYANTPSGFFVENGWGGRVIDPVTWEPHETTCGPSFWGHDRLYLPEEGRAKFKDMRMDLAAQGVQSPPVAECPWLFGQLSNGRRKG